MRKRVRERNNRTKPPVVFGELAFQKAYRERGTDQLVVVVFYRWNQRSGAAALAHGLGSVFVHVFRDGRSGEEKFVTTADRCVPRHVHGGVLQFGGLRGVLDRVVVVLIGRSTETHR